MGSKHLAKAAARAGIAASYINARGERQNISADTRQRLLAAMGSATDHEANAPLPPVKVFIVGRTMAFSPQCEGEYQWLLITESAERQYRGYGQSGQALTLPPDLPLGYHRLTLMRENLCWHCRIIVAPQRCYEPKAVRAGKKLWGACVQLYTLRSDNNWGIGDFGDLKKMLGEIARRGGAFIGLNPVHALYPANPESASPYSPSSRRWLNVMYIDVTAVEDFQHSAAAQAWWRRDETQNALAAAREAQWVDYSAVAALKIAALRLAWQQFTTRDAQDDAFIAFRQYVGERGAGLYRQAAYDALHAHLMQKDAANWGWPVWPEGYREAASPEVAAFCQTHADEVDFWLWLQWLAYSQFAACWAACRDADMPIGLYRDLAVGVAQGGCETWGDSELYCMEATVGAPPDNHNPLGQNWGLAPMNPHVMAARAYDPFIALLSANMENCGALRIDHVMALLRLWWIPCGETADKGAYVAYPVDDLLAILALESHRHRCMVIGEDLGIVPVELVDKLRDSGVYSYKVLYFEQDGANHLRAPQAWPEQAMAVATTHDLPTLRGWWESGDLTLGNRLGLYPDEAAFNALCADRARAKQGLLDALHQYGCLPAGAGRKASRMAMTPLLNRGMQRYTADSRCALLGLQPEDWLDIATPVNVPGTSSEYKNWRRKLTATLEAMFADEGVNRLLKDLNRRRRKLTRASRKA
ncbi:MULTISPECIES: 4-alpha-glucanotransferase [Tenebrionibacter/Tenebrionicola group]|jgi:4-alpha-glucanotransferase|uniref:4-alpha-glucanotransferase n=2 Tax=Tenebrionibacter/Tenebrionicola group TaxID=2969848 RepID=A0A8K0V6Q1_9ENTR|nr:MULTISPECIES: 4-alpha-glucanotransferase [Tenebrionibacter/Tenebrionicola group]MBK4716120.1 4-alpha-glucanotransferase [Tenebrionibacter intestinalis]MBV5095950.1 4-alpha-glucanotransferase [Tenebrionicola larvae]